MCPLTYNPLCGNDGVTYGNPCILEQQNCFYGKNVVKKSDGKCWTCEKKTFLCLSVLEACIAPHFILQTSHTLKLLDIHATNPCLNRQQSLATKVNQRDYLVSEIPYLFDAYTLEEGGNNLSLQF